MYDYTAGAAGVSPLEPFKASQTGLLGTGGVSLGIYLAVVDVLGDWPAWLKLAGLRSWSHNRYPCFACNIPRSVMLSSQSLVGWSVNKCPFYTWTDADYEAELRRSRTVINVATEEIRQAVFKLLIYVKVLRFFK